MNVHAIRRSVGHLLCPLIVVAWGFWCGRPAAAQAVSPTLIVSLLQQSTGIATIGKPTYVEMALQLSGSSSSAFTTSGFSTVLTWSTTSAGVVDTNLYTVNSGTVPTIGTTAMRVNQPGYLFYTDPNPDLELPQPIPDMNVTNVDADTQRFVSVLTGDPSRDVTIPAGTFGPITIMRVRFGVAAGINSALFNFSLNTNSNNYGFNKPDFSGYYAVTDGGGSMLVTPEPDAMTALFFAAFSTGGWSLMRRRVSRRLESIAAT